MAVGATLCVGKGAFIASSSLLLVAPRDGAEEADHHRDAEHEARQQRRLRRHALRDLDVVGERGSSGVEGLSA